jgi:hypothetical protein
MFGAEVERRQALERQRLTEAQALAAERDEAAREAGPVLAQMGADAARTLRQHAVEPTVALVACATTGAFRPERRLHLLEHAWDLSGETYNLVPRILLSYGGALGLPLTDKPATWGGGIKVRDGKAFGKKRHDRVMDPARETRLSWARDAGPSRALDTILEIPKLQPLAVEGYAKSLHGKPQGFLFDRPSGLVWRGTHLGDQVEIDVVRVLVDRVAQMVSG